MSVCRYDFNEWILKTRPNHTTLYLRFHGKQRGKISYACVDKESGKTKLPK